MTKEKPTSHDGTSHPNYQSLKLRLEATEDQLKKTAGRVSRLTASNQSLINRNKKLTAELRDARNWNKRLEGMLGAVRSGPKGISLLRLGLAYLTDIPFIGPKLIEPIYRVKFRTDQRLINEVKK